MNQTHMNIADCFSSYASRLLCFLGFNKMQECFGLQSRNFTCGYQSYDCSPVNLLVLLFLAVLVWMVFQLSGQYKSLNRICVELNKRSLAVGPEFNAKDHQQISSCKDGLSGCSADSSERFLELSKGNVEKVLANGFCRDEISAFLQKNGCSNCKVYLVCENKSSSGSFSIKDILDDENHEEMDLGKYCSENLENNSEADAEETDLSRVKKAIRIEREYRDAAYLELEKERKAAASAADEAMTMILRIQNEKNSVEMKARQYRRVAEQKQLYDQEVIQSLHEIISKQELERGFLEDQLEMYRQKLIGRRFCNGSVEEDKRDETHFPSSVKEQKKFDSQVGQEVDADYLDSDLMSENCLSNSGTAGYPDKEFDHVEGRDCSLNFSASKNCIGGFFNGVNSSLGIASPVL